MNGRVLNVHIDRIVLNGLDVDADRADSLRSSLISELERVLIERGLEGIEGISVPSISVPGVKASELRSSDQIAGKMAHSVYRAFGGRGY